MFTEGNWQTSLLMLRVCRVLLLLAATHVLLQVPADLPQLLHLLHDSWFDHSLTIHARWLFGKFMRLAATAEISFWNWSEETTTKVTFLDSLSFEPPHDKTNKMTVCPAKTQISQQNCSVFSVYSAGRKELTVSSCGQHGLWSDWVDGQSDPSLQWLIGLNQVHFSGWLHSL